MNADVGWLEPTVVPDLPAGEFSDWLARMDDALRGGAGSDVPCGDCTACCRGSYFVHIASGESGALSRIPEDLLFPAPGTDGGQRLLGYDETGRCPMLMDDSCTIYRDRPRTCRSYDCRIFAATGLAETAPEKAEIMARAGRWRFDYATQEDSDRHEALRKGARYLLEQADGLGDLLPGNATQLAMLVVSLNPLIFELLAAHGGKIPAAPQVLARVRDAIEGLKPRHRRVD